MPIVKPPKATEVKGTETLPQVKFPCCLQITSETILWKCLKHLSRLLLQVNGVNKGAGDDEEMEDASANEEVSK